ncbi:hypothetical protein [Nocardioides dongkuii]|uniref:hypothetical protein n=1 Tax=Nocardioides dongkuii TaxID=2760089 RepID=UPI0015FCBAE6|nr:hypothetical protein [Nocardioides dongkuii]
MTGRPRPSSWWFVLGGGLLVAAAATGVALFVGTLGGFLAVDATVPVDGDPHRVEVGTDGDRLLWVEGPAPDCTVVDAETGTAIALDRVGASYRREVNGVERTGRARFDPGSGELEVTCTGAPGMASTEVEIGPTPRVGNLAGGIVATILVPLLLAGLGLAVLLAAGLVWSARATTRR